MERMEPEDVDRLMRERIGETIGNFALGDPQITLDELIEAVTGELLLSAETVDDLFNASTGRTAELFCTP